MEIKILNKDLANALTNVGNVISAKTIEPILQNVLLKEEDGSVYLIGTNLEQAIKVKLNGKIEEKDGEIKSTVLPYALLKAIVSKFDMGEETILAISSKQGYIKQKSSSYKINCLDPEAFAVIPETEEKIKFEMKLALLRKLTENTLFAVSKKDETRKEFSGVYFESEEGKIRFVGTDSTVLAVSETNSENLPESSFIIPWKALDIVDRLNTNGENVLVLANDEQIEFVTEGVSVTSLLINGKFPPYKSAIPKESEFFALVNKDEILTALNRLEIIAKKGNEKITLMFSENTLTATAVYPEIGEGREKLNFEGKAEISIVFYGEKLIEGISHIGSDTVEIYMNGPLHPVKIKGKDDDTFMYVVMPQRPS